MSSDTQLADPSRAVYGVGLQSLVCWNCGFEYRRGAFESAFCECCALSGWGLCDGPITRPEESYRVWCVWVWSWSLDNEDVLAPKGAVAPWKKKSR